MNDYFFTEADVCKCCIFNDYERIGPTSIQVKIYDGELFKLSEVPSPLLKKVFEKMNQKSFTRTRRTNKSIYDFIEKYRRFIKISLFHNWNLTYEHKKTSHIPIAIFTKNHLQFSRRSLKPFEDSNQSFSSLEMDEFFGDRAIAPRNKMTPKKQSSLFNKLMKLSLSPRKKIEDDPDAPYTIKGLKKITQTTCISACGFSLDLEEFQKSEFLQREFTGNYHPCSHHVAYNEVIDDTGREERLRSNMEPFIHFAKFMKHKGGFLWFDKITPEVVHEFSSVLEPTGLFLNNNGLMRVWTTPDLDEHFFRTNFLDLRVVSLTDCPKLKPEAIRYLLQSAEVFSVTFRGDELFAIFIEALEDWREGNSKLKNLNFTNGQKFTAELMRSFESLSYRTITPGNYNLLLQEIPRLSMHPCHFGELKLQFLLKTINQEKFALLVVSDRKTCTFHTL